MAAVAVTVTPAGAVTEQLSKAEVERHCIAHVVDASSDVQATRTAEPTEVCFSTEAEVDAYLGAGLQRSSTTTIGRHYKGTNYSGSSITIVGTTCSGGVWYATGSWNNNIESSHYFCGSAGTRFYDSSSCTGNGLTTTSNLPTLGWMNNRTSCVRYG